MKTDPINGSPISGKYCTLTLNILDTNRHLKLKFQGKCLYHCLPQVKMLKY